MPFNLNVNVGERLNHYLIIEEEMDPDSMWIEELCKSNHAPTDEVAQTVKKSLLRPLKGLEDLDSEILELKMRLSALESKRNESQKWIYRHQSILAPIRRVSPDVLGEIFYHGLPTHRNSIMKSSDCPLLLTRVCSTLRTTATTTPKLWDRLHIIFTDDDAVPDLDTASEMARNGQRIADEWRDAQPKAENKHTIQMLCRRHGATKEWFLPSGTRHLSISMYLTTSTSDTVPYSKRPPSIMMELLFLLASLAPRWKEFVVRAPFRLYNILEDMLSVSQMTSFEVDDPGLFYPTQGTEPETRPTPKLLAAPSLRKLSISGGIPKIL